jgi:hypothetical protein
VRFAAAHAGDHLVLAKVPRASAGAAGWALDTTTNDAVLDFQNGILTRRWLHGPATDEPLVHESYASAATPGTGTAQDLHRVLAKLIRPACASGSSPLLHIRRQKERHQTARGPVAEHRRLDPQF